MRMHGTAKGLPDSTNQGSNARDRESPSSVTQYPRTRSSPAVNRDYDAAIRAADALPETPGPPPTGPPNQPFIGAVYVVSGPVFVGRSSRGPQGGVVSPHPAPPVDEVHGAHHADGRDRDQGRGRDATHVEPPVPEAEGHLGAAQRRFHVVPDDGSDAPRILRIEVEADLERERGRAQGRIQPVVAVARVDVGRSTFLEHLVSVRVRHLDGEVTESVVVRGRQPRVRPGIENPLSGAVIRHREDRRVREREVPDRLALRDLARSEEHTSELQSPCNLVCRLLLEKK